MVKRSAVYALVALVAFVLIASLSVRAPIGGRPDPLPSHMFNVEIDGIVQTSFKEVSGLTCSTEMIEYRDGNDPGRIRLLPGVTRCGPITLKGGLTENRELWNWYADTVDGGPVPRKNGSVIILDSGRTERARYNFYEAFPISYEIGPLDASAGGVLLETVTIAVEWIERA